MRYWVKVFSVILSIVTVICFTCIPVAAASSSEVAEFNQRIAQRKAELEKKYNISISYPFSTNSAGDEVAGIYLFHLNTLDQVLEYVSPQVVKQLSGYYDDRNDRKLSFNYKYASQIDMSDDFTFVQAQFDLNTSTIDMFISRKGKSSETMGDTPLAIIHELGHAFHFLSAEKYGSDNLEKEWKAFNSGIAYNENNLYQNPNSKVFVSGYAATDIHEDFAEVFAYGFICNRAGLGFTSDLTSDGKDTSLKKKFQLVEKLLGQCLNDSSVALPNFRKVYSCQRTLKYENQSISGVFLQYIGFGEPRNKPLYTLDELGVDAAGIYWVAEIGGWRGTMPNGNNLLVFPNGYWGEWAA